MNRDRLGTLREDEVVHELLEHIETHPCAAPLGLPTLERLTSGTMPPEEAEGANLHIGQCLYCLSAFTRVQSLLESGIPATAAMSRRPRRIWKFAAEGIRRALNWQAPAWLLPIAVTAPAAVAIALWVQFGSGTRAEVSPRRALSTPVPLAMLAGNQCPTVSGTTTTPRNANTRPSQDAISRVATAANEAVVQVIAFAKESGLRNCASGFFISEDGQVVTTSHVVQGARDVVVKLATGAMFPVERVVSVRSDVDLVVLKVAGRGLPNLKLGDSDKVTIGEAVVAVGSPFGLQNSVTTGIISSIRSQDDHVIIQTTAPISPGSSGSPLLNNTGEVIGIATSSVAGSQNINFAVASNEVTRLRAGSKPTTDEEKALQAYLTAQLEMNKKDYLAAEKSLVMATRLNPKNVDAWLDLGYIYYRLRKRDNEGETYKTALKIEPNNSEAHYALGTWYEDAGDFELAVKEYRAAVTSDPKDDGAWFDLGELELIQGRKSKAIEAYERLRAINPGLALRLKKLLEIADAARAKSQR